MTTADPFVQPISNQLDMSKRQLVRIPGYVFENSDLEALNVSYNKLTGAIPAEIGHLKKLKVLNLSYNQMTGLPAEIGHLPDLEILNVSYNQLTGLPQELGDLQKLRVLDLSGNPYSETDLAAIRQRLPKTTVVVTGE